MLLCLETASPTAFILVLAYNYRLAHIAPLYVIGRQLSRI